MNIVYKFTSSVTGRWYIGSKTECKVVGGSIISKTGREYFTSSSDEELIAEFSKGNMVLEILEDNVLRENLLDVEAHWQLQFKALDDPKSYNKVIANRVGSTYKDKPKNPPRMGSTIINKFGQTVNEFANNSSVVSRKDAKAKQVGFPNYGSMVYLILLEKQKDGVSIAELDRRYNQRGFFKRCLSGTTLEDFENRTPKDQIRAMMLEGASFLKACELLKTSHVVARHEFGEYFYNILDIEERLAIVNGFTSREELDKFIMRQYLAGKPLKQVSLGLDNISHSTVRRVVDRLTREKLSVKDLE